MSAVTTFVEAQNAHITVSLEDIKGLWKSVSWSHRIGRPWQEVSHKMEPTSFLGRRKYIKTSPKGGKAARTEARRFLECKQILECPESHLMF